MINGFANDKPIIGNISNTPLQDIKLKKGDLILEINDSPIEKFSDIIVKYNELDYKKDTNFLIKRNDDVLRFIIPNLFLPLIKSIEPLSPASRAGLLPGDFILSVNGIRTMLISINPMPPDEGFEITCELLEFGLSRA